MSNKSPSLKLNVIANYVSQIYVAGVGILILPLYIKYMGAEVFGLVGFFTMLQAWFGLLDMGLTPTIARETARFRGGASKVLEYRALVRALEVLFLGTALLGGGGLFLFSEEITHSWLQIESLSLDVVKYCIQVMVVSVSLRWMTGLYRGVVSGSEKLVWLSTFNMVIATLRFLVVLPILIFVDSSPETFFSFQLGVAILELLIMWMKGRTLLPLTPKGTKIGWSIAVVKPKLKFALSVAFTSSMWVMITQTDKLILSKFLTLTEYGYFTLAVLVASSIVLLTGPIKSALLPRMTRIEAENNQTALVELYCTVTQAVTIMAIPMATTIAVYAKPILWAWTGDIEVVEKANQILSLYVLGYGVLALSAFPYYLQYAKGDLKLHLIGNVVLAIMLIPSIIVATLNYGGIGAAYAWFISNLLYFIVWVPIVHRKFMPLLHIDWLLKNILPVFIIACICAYLSPHITTQLSRFTAIILPICFGGVVMILSGFSVPLGRKVVMKLARNKLVFK